MIECGARRRVHVIYFVWHDIHNNALGVNIHNSDAESGYFRK